MATVRTTKKVADIEKVSEQRIHKTVTTLHTEESLTIIKPASETRSQSPGKRKSRPPSLVVRDQEAFNTKHLQLLKLCDLALAFLVCLVKQDTNPLPDSSSSKRSKSHKSDNHDGESFNDNGSDKNWDQNRKQLDDIFCSLASWRRDLEHDRPQVILHQDSSLISVVDWVVTSFLTIAHQLTHLVDPNRKRTSDTDTVLLEVTKNLAEMVNELKEERGIVDDCCPVCSDQEHNDTSEYLDGMRWLVRDLKEDSKPLQLAMRRHDWLEHTACSTKRLSGRFDESGGRFHKERHGTNLSQETSGTSSPRRSESPTASELTQTRNFARPLRWTRSMGPRDDQNEVNDKAGD